MPSPLLATHTEPAPTATPAGDSPDWDRRRHRSRVRVDPHDRVIERVGHPHAALADRDPGRCCCRPRSASAARSGRPGRRCSASVSVSQTAPSPIAIPAGLAFGSSCRTILPVRRPGASAARSSGATHTELPCAATAPGPPGTTLPIRHRAAERVELRDRCGRPDTLVCGRVRTQPPTHRPRGVAAIPVGGPPTGIARSVRSVVGSMREIVWSSRLATHSDPEPNAIAPGESPTATARDHAVAASVDRRHRVRRHPHRARAGAGQLHRDRDDQRASSSAARGRDQRPAAPPAPSGAARGRAVRPGRADRAPGRGPGSLARAPEARAPARARARRRSSRRASR